MEHRSRQQRADDAAADLGHLALEGLDRMGYVLLPCALISLVLQCLLLVVGVRTVQQLYRVRHLGVRPLLSVASNGPLLGLSVLGLANWLVTRWLSSWVKRVNAIPAD